MKFWIWYSYRTVFIGRQLAKLMLGLTLVSLSIGVAVIIVATGIAEGFEREIKYKVSNYIADVRITAYAPEKADSLVYFSLEQDTLEKIKAASPVIKSVMPIITASALIKSDVTLEGVVLRGLPKFGISSFFRDAIVAGSLPQWPDTGWSNQVLISKSLASLLEVEPQNKVRLYFLDNNKIRVRPVVIVGLFDTGLNEIDKHTVLCHAGLIQRLNRLSPNLVHGYDVHFERDGDTTGVYQALSYWLPYNVQVVKAGDLFFELFEWLSLQQQNVFFIVILMLIVAVVNLSSNVIVSIVERRGALAILKVLGATDGQIRTMYAWQASWLLVFGLIIGNGIGLSILAVQDYTGFIRLDSESYFLKTAPVAYPWLSFLITNFIFAMGCLLAIFLPLSRINNIKPAAAISQEGL